MAMQQPQPHPVPHRELQRAVLGVVKPARLVLCLQQPGTHLLKKLITISKQHTHQLRLGAPRGVGQQVGRRTAIDDHQWRGPQSIMERSVVAVFHPRQPVQPVARAIPRETAEVHAQHLVDGLGLAICLRVESYAHAQLDAGLLEEIPPHSAREHRITIADNRLGETVEAHDVAEERACDRHCCIGMTQRNEVRGFRLVINELCAVICLKALD